MDVVEGQAEDGELGQLLLLPSALLPHLWQGLAESLEALVDVFHSHAFPGVGRAAAVLAERRRLALALGLFRRGLTSLHLHPLHQGAQAQVVRVTGVARCRFRPVHFGLKPAAFAALGIFSRGLRAAALRGASVQR